MIRPDQIPDAVVEAAAKAIYWAFTEINIGDGEDRWERLLPRFRAEYREQARASIAAALNAWPSGAVCHYTIADTEGWEMVLPLPMEADHD